jgi:hypothetical protein
MGDDYSIIATGHSTAAPDRMLRARAHKTHQFFTDPAPTRTFVTVDVTWMTYTGGIHLSDFAVVQSFHLSPAYSEGDR